MIICWEHCVFYILIGCKGESREGSGMNTGCHGVAFCLWEILDYLPVGVSLITDVVLNTSFLQVEQTNFCASCFKTNLKDTKF